MTDNARRVAPKTGCNLAAARKENGLGREFASPEATAVVAAAAEKETLSNKKKEVPRDNPFDQYYAQLIHQQNMLQDSVRVSAYQSAICENAADFKVGMRRSFRTY